MKRWLFGNKFNTFFFLYGIVNWIIFSSEFNQNHKQTKAVEICVFFFCCSYFFLHSRILCSFCINDTATEYEKTFKIDYFYFVSSSANSNENMKPKWNHRRFGLITKSQFSMWFMQSELSIWFENTIIYWFSHKSFILCHDDLDEFDFIHSLLNSGDFHEERTCYSLLFCVSLHNSIQDSFSTKNLILHMITDKLISFILLAGGRFLHHLDQNHQEHQIWS